MYLTSIPSSHSPHTPRFFKTSLLCLVLPLFLFLSQLTVLAELPSGFVYLKDIDPSIYQNIRYATSENFVGHPIPGYKNNTAILTEQATRALSQVQKELLQEGYSLVVYDAYRPQKAVDAFMEWSKNPHLQEKKLEYYPRVNKEDVFKLGYVAEKSGHSRGSTVDLTLIRLPQISINLNHIELIKRTLTDGFEVYYLQDGTLDMGTSFDLFDLASHHDTTLIAKEYLDRRNYLREKMKKHGFNEYQEEWWHYTLNNEPFPDTYFDFDIQ